MTGEWPFTVHQNSDFHTLITKLTNLEVVVLETQNHASRLSIKDSATLLEVFRNIFFSMQALMNQLTFVRKIKWL